MSHFAFLPLTFMTFLNVSSRPGSQNYSRLSVNTALVADVTSVVKVGRGHFLPPPKVDSRVIKLVPVANRIVPPSLANEKLFFQVRNLVGTRASHYPG
jgi:18S rRNA (adenine1779-N6/adenine1780-N6)-dimethyltransferase